MATIHYVECDRCKARIKNISTNKYVIAIDNENTYDLCSDCITEFHYFMNRHESIRMIAERGNLNE